MSKYDEFDLGVKEITNSNYNNGGSPRAATGWECVTNAYDISQFITDALSCASCGVCSAGGRSQCGPCTVSSMRMEARC